MLLKDNSKIKSSAIFKIFFLFMLRYNIAFQSKAYESLCVKSEKYYNFLKVLHVVVATT